MADRAIGDEDGRIHVIGVAASDDFGTIDVERGPVAAIGRQTMEPRRCRSDPAARRSVT